MRLRRDSWQRTPAWSFNTASGMRSHVTAEPLQPTKADIAFQYRKRYEVTCDIKIADEERAAALFQYRKRYEVTCDSRPRNPRSGTNCCFNTASGMRSHATPSGFMATYASMEFQYRKRYEVTCDVRVYPVLRFLPVCFNTASGMRSHATSFRLPWWCRLRRVSIPQAV